MFCVLCVVAVDLAACGGVAEPAKLISNLVEVQSGGLFEKEKDVPVCEIEKNGWILLIYHSITQIYNARLPAWTEG